MASATILTHGCVALTDCPLMPSAIYADHRTHHLECDSNCYIHRLVAVARYGFEIRKPSIAGVRSPRSRLFNHPPFNLFGTLSDAALSKQIIQSGACRQLPRSSSKSGRNHNLVFSPLLTVIRNSDLWRAAAVGVEVIDEQSLIKVNALLDPPIKLRACIDLASSGVNELQPDFPFMYCSLDDALALVNDACWMAKIDLQGMFHSIGLSHASRKYFCFRDRSGAAHQYIRACFGGKLFPAIASAFMAEVMYIARALNVICVSYVDDFFVTGVNYAECLSKRNIIIDILERHGWTINFDKVTDPSQILDFLGTLIDSQKMIVSVSPEKAACVAFKLERVWSLIPSDPTAAAKLLHSLLGSLVWFSTVVTCGRLWNHSLFRLLQSLIGHRMKTLPDLLVDCEPSVSAWRHTLKSWSLGSAISANVRLLPPHSLSNSIYMQCDAGDEGLGYWLTLPSTNFERLHWYSRRLPESPSTQATSSTWKELNTVLWALQSHSEWRGLTVIAVLDSAAAAYNLNSGSCASDSFSTLHDIFTTCDIMSVHIIALWVPREDNSFADYLTHHCMQTSSEVDSGVVQL